MSVQLILYPQNYNGQYNLVSAQAEERLVDGIIFGSINTSGTYSTSSANPIITSIVNGYVSGASIINTWYRYRSTGSGTPTYPAEVSDNLRLYSTTTNTTSGVYQRLSNLVVGQVYTIWLVYSTTGSPTGTLTVESYNGNTPAPLTSQTYALSGGIGFVVHNFQAATVKDTITVALTNTIADDLDITNISVLPQGVTPNLTAFDLEDGQVICDLYEEEDIPLTLSVDEFKNVAENVQSYSKDFNLPETKRNNLIFNHIFDITRDDDGIIFNPYKRTKCVLKQDGFILFEGYLRLIEISQDKEGEISYSVNLYSEVIALADILEDKTFSDLDLTELEHGYQKNNIKNSWDSTGITYLNASTSGYRGVDTMRYPFVDWEHQILLANGATGNNATLGFPELTSLEQAFRPFINVKYLIQRIFSQSDIPFTFNSDFFDTADFKKLYMDFNWGAGNAPNDFFSTGQSRYGDANPDNYAPNGSYGTMLFPDDYNVTPPNSWKANSGFDSSTSVFTAIQDNTTYTMSSHMFMVEFIQTATLTMEAFSTTDGVMDQITISRSAGDVYTYSGTLNTTLQTSGVLYWRFKSNVTLSVKQYNSVPYGAAVWGQVSSYVYTSAQLLNTLRGELGQWEFLKGILTMFNIVSLPDKDNPLNITFEPYSDVFISSPTGTSLADRGINHDWTDKVDVSQMKLTPLTNLNKSTIFQYEEDEGDYTFKVYKKSVGGFLYGSKEFDASGFNILQGRDEIIASPFAATLSKPLAGQFSDFITPAIFTSNDEATEFEGFDNAPRILYNNGKKSASANTFTSCTYYIPEQNGYSSENANEYLQFSHLTTIPTVPAAADFNFGECQLINPIGSPVTNNLFNLYWLPYYNELYNPNTRIMTMEVNLNAGDINMFKFNDKVMIKNRVFRVNKIEYKPDSLAKVEFILIP